MIGLKDIVTLLERWDKWKEISATPAKTAALEGRVAALEERFKRAPGEICPKCGQPEFRTEEVVKHPNSILALGGAKVQKMKCAECGYTEGRDELVK